MKNDSISLMTNLAIVTIVEAACIKKPVMPEPLPMVKASKINAASKRNFFIYIIMILTFNCFPS
jgi:hypothetical protein